MWGSPHERSLGYLCLLHTQDFCRRYQGAVRFQRPICDACAHVMLTVDGRKLQAARFPPLSRTTRGFSISGGRFRAAKGRKPLIRLHTGHVGCVNCRERMEAPRNPDPGRCWISCAIHQTSRFFRRQERALPETVRVKRPIRESALKSPARSTPHALKTFLGQMPSSTM